MDLELNVSSNEYLLFVIVPKYKYESKSTISIFSKFLFCNWLKFIPLRLSSMHRSTRPESSIETVYLFLVATDFSFPLLLLPLFMFHNFDYDLRHSETKAIKTTQTSDMPPFANKTAPTFPIALFRTSPLPASVLLIQKQYRRLHKI